MINFLDEKYGTKVSCSQVTQDGFEVDNLVTRNSNSVKATFSLKSGGFLVEHFIRPPVDVDFSFLFPIHISRVELGLNVGAQTTDGIEVLVANGQDGNGVFRVVYHQCPVARNSLKISNPCFKSRPPFIDAELCKPGGRNQNSLFKFSHLLNSVTTLRVRIIKTLGSSVPAIGSVKIFGIPAWTCKSEDWRKALCLYSSNYSNYDDNDSDIQILPSEQLEKVEVAASEVQVPEEFIDPITFEIMILPVTLPCGKSVDQSTLEKSSTSQATWGRLPCDPFTGIPFGPDRKPINNSSLKARIDAFLIKNAHLDIRLAKVPRTIGRSPKDFMSNGAPSTSNMELSTVTVSLAPRAQSKESQLTVDLRPDNSARKTSHEMALQESLNLAMNLHYKESSRKSFEVDTFKAHNNCTGCRTSRASWYKLPCGHFLCRMCLLGSHNTCLQCRKHFLKEQVCRTYHTS